MPMPAPLPPRKKKSTGTSEKRSGEYGADDGASPTSRAAPPVPLPGLSRVRSPEETNRQLGHDDETTPISASRPADEVPDVEDVVPSNDRSAPPPVPQHETGAPPIPGGRSAPPPVPKESRPVPAPMSPSAGSESDDEMSAREQPSSVPQPLILLEHHRDRLKDRDLQNHPMLGEHLILALKPHHHRLQHPE